MSAEAGAENQEAKKVIIDGIALSEDDAKTVEELRICFKDIRRALNKITYHLHNVDRHKEYLESAHQRFSNLLQVLGSIQLRVDAMSYRFRGVDVFTDEAKDNNLIYGFWQSGIRIFIFKAGLTIDELLGFLGLPLGIGQETAERGEDLVTRLWKSEFDNIEYVVLEGFVTSDDEEDEDVEAEVEQVVNYLYKQLQSNSDDFLRFARVNVADLELELNDIDQIRGAVISGVTATEADKIRVQKNLGSEQKDTLPKLITVLFQLLELDTTDENFEDVAEAFVQLLDALLLQENFAAIMRIVGKFGRAMQRPQVGEATRGLIQQCEERFVACMRDVSRIQTVGAILNAGLAKDVEAVKAYLMFLGPECVGPIVDILENIQLLPNRRLVCTVLAKIGKGSVPLFTTRLNHPSSNLVKDMLYIIDQIDPPEKFALFANVLRHDNAILRLETLSLIGRNPQQSCFDLMKKVLMEYDDAQMRSQAARCLPNYPADWSVPLLLDIMAPENIIKRGEPEQRALFTALGQIDHPATQEYLQSIFKSRSGLFSKKRDDVKMMAITALESSPSIQNLQFLMEIAQDTKKHSKEVCEIALEAARQMKSRFMGV